MKIPDKLNEAALSMPVKNTLAGLPLTSLSKALMEHTEMEHERFKGLSRLSEILNISLAAADSEELGIDAILADEDEGEGLRGAILDADPEAIGETLALCDGVLTKVKSYLADLATTREKLNASVDYAHILARFLLKRHKSYQRILATQAARDGPNKAKSNQFIIND